MRQIIKLKNNVNVGGRGHNSGSALVALCDDGSLWALKYSELNREATRVWDRLPDIPQDVVEPVVENKPDKIYDRREKL